MLNLKQALERKRNERAVLWTFYDQDHYSSKQIYFKGFNQCLELLWPCVEALERAQADMGNAAACNVRFRVEALTRMDKAIEELKGKVGM